jgi:hypothetical protein
MLKQQLLLKKPEKQNMLISWHKQLNGHQK